jgi:hypothetical protein
MSATTFSFSDIGIPLQMHASDRWLIRLHGS